MAEEDAALMTVRGGSEPMTLEFAAAQLGIAASDIDRNYGIVPLDTQNQLFAVKVRAGSLRTSPPGSGDYRGPFADPRIEPAGPVEEADRPSASGDPSGKVSGE